MSVKLGGVISGIDSTGIIEKLTALERKPIEQKKAQQTALLDQSDAIGFINSSLGALKTKSQVLSDASLFRSKAATSSNSAVGTATIDNTVSSTITNTSLSLNITQLSTQSVFKGTRATNTAIAATDTVVSALGSSILSSGSAIFTVRTGGDGAGGSTPRTYSSTITSTTTIQNVLDDVNAQFGAGFFSFNAATRTFQVSPAAGDGLVTLSTQQGSFLQQAQLFNPQGLQTELFSPIPDTSIAGTGDFFLKGEQKLVINGVLIDFGAASSMNSVIASINGAGLGLQATLATDFSDLTKTKFALVSENGQPVTVKKLTGETFDLNSLTESFFNSNPAAINSVNGVGRLDTTATISSGADTLTINGVTFTPNGKSLDALLTEITSSTAGVTATYDNYTDQIVFTAQTLGNRAINVSGTGTFVSDYGLTGSSTSYSAGKSTIFSINGGASRVSDDGTLDSSELGVTGLSFSAKDVGTTTISIGADTAKVKTAIDDFVNQYNAVQNLILSYTAINVSDTTKSGILASDTTINSLPSQLRVLVGGAFADTSSSSLSLRVLEDLGIKGNSSDNTFTTSDSAILDTLLNSSPEEFVDFFTDIGGTDGYKGLYTQVSTLIDAYNQATSGILTNRQTNIATEVLRLNDEISLTEARITAETAAWEAAFASLESTTAQSQQFSSYLQSFSNNKN